MHALFWSNVHFSLSHDLLFKAPVCIHFQVTVYHGRHIFSSLILSLTAPILFLMWSLTNPISVLMLPLNSSGDFLEDITCSFMYGEYLCAWPWPWILEMFSLDFRGARTSWDETRDVWDEVWDAGNGYCPNWEWIDSGIKWKEVLKECSAEDGGVGGRFAGSGLQRETPGSDEGVVADGIWIWSGWTDPWGTWCAYVCPFGMWCIMWRGDDMPLGDAWWFCSTRCTQCDRCCIRRMRTLWLSPSMVAR